MPQLLERAVLVLDAAWNPFQKRERDGKFAKGTGGGAAKKPKFSKLEQALAKEAGVTPEEARKRLQDQLKVGDIKDQARRKQLGLDQALTPFQESQLREQAKKDPALKEALDARERAKQARSTKPIVPNTARAKLDEALAKTAAVKVKPPVKLMPRRSVLGGVTKLAEKVPGVGSTLSAFGIGTGSVLKGKGSLIAKLAARSGKAASMLGVHGFLAATAAAVVIHKLTEEGPAAAAPAAAWLAWETVMGVSQLKLLGRLNRLNAPARARAVRYADRLKQRMAATAAKESRERPLFAKLWDKVGDYASGRDAIPGS